MHYQTRLIIKLLYGISAEKLVEIWTRIERLEINPNVNTQYIAKVVLRISREKKDYTLYGTGRLGYPCGGKNIKFLVYRKKTYQEN